MQRGEQLQQRRSCNREELQGGSSGNGVGAARGEQLQGGRSGNGGAAATEEELQRGEQLKRGRSCKGVAAARGEDLGFEDVEEKKSAEKGGGQGVQKKFKVNTKNGGAHG